MEDLGLIPGLGRSPGGGHGNPLQYSWLENPMDSGAWWAPVHRVAKRWIQLKPLKVKMWVPQSDCSPPDSSVHEVFQARILEWVAILFSRDLHNPGIEPKSPTLQADSLWFEPPGKPLSTHTKNSYISSKNFRQEWEKALIFDSGWLSPLRVADSHALNPKLVLLELWLQPRNFFVIPKFRKSGKYDKKW